MPASVSSGKRDMARLVISQSQVPLNFTATPSRLPAPRFALPPGNPPPRRGRRQRPTFIWSRSDDHARDSGWTAVKLSPRNGPEHRGSLVLGILIFSGRVRVRDDAPSA